MFLFPLRPSGHFAHKPYATVGLVTANLAVAVFVGLWEPYWRFFAATDRTLLHGMALAWDEFNPLQWITSAFVHGNVAHLAGNMIFLLTFGVVVEGTLGWKRFLAFYLGVSAVECALEQILFSHGISYGASSAIFGLLTAAWIWNPRQEVTVFYWVWRWVDVRDFPVVALAWWWIGWEVLGSMAWSFLPSTPVLHVLGALVGGVAAYAMLRLGLVDTGGEDWFALRAARRAREESGWTQPLPPAPPVRMDDLVRSLVSWSVAALGGLLVGVGVLLPRLLEWSEPERRSLNAVLIFVALGLFGAGLLVFRYWRDHF